jgi:hypothetical protein
MPLLAGTSGDVVTGWYLNCQSPPGTPCTDANPYVAALDRQVVFQGAASLSVASDTSVAPTFGGVNQIASAEGFRGKRLRYSAAVRIANVSHWAGLWLRADDPAGRVLAFDNMGVSKRGLSGTRDWERQSVVLDIPEEANVISYGLLLSGPGKAWLDDVKLEVVAPNVPVTFGSPTWEGDNPAIPPNRLKPPRNLDFEQPAIPQPRPATP